MSRILGAFTYYLRCTGRNRISSLKRKLKSPRYLIGLVLACAYIYFFFVRNLMNGRMGSSADSANFGRYGLTFFYAMSFFMAWILGPFGRGVVFREAEIQQLFSTPLARWHLLLFKFFQAQGQLLITALIFAVFVSRHATLPFVLVVAALYLVGALAHVHAILASLTTRALREKDGLVSFVAFVPGIAILGSVFLGVWLGIQGQGGVKAGPSLVAVLESPLLSTILRPLTILADFVLHMDGLSFGIMALAVMALTTIFAVLVVVFDHRFEDRAVKVAALVANVKKDGLTALRKKDKLVVKETRASFPKLAPVGKVWRAIVWKNVVSIGRLQKKAFRILLSLLLVAFFLASAIGDDATDAKVGAIIGFVSMGIAVYACLLGPALLRVDLRIDIPHFDVLKSMPIRGRDLLIGEVMGPTLVLAMAQWCLTILGALALPAKIGSHDLVAIERLAIILTAIPSFFAVVFALFTLENLLALYLPSFARLGRGMKSGFDQFGQNLMGAVLRLLTIVIMLIPAAAVGALVVLAQDYLFGWPPQVIVPVTAWICSGVIVGGCYFLLCLGENRYEVFDLSAEALTVDA